jgi:hypothetical protein
MAPKVLDPGEFEQRLSKLITDLKDLFDDCIVTANELTTMKEMYLKLEKQQGDFKKKADKFDKLVEQLKATGLFNIDLEAL